MSAQELFKFGKQLVWVEATDALWAQFAGQVLGTELREMLDFRNEWAAGRAYYFMIADLSAATGVDLEARRAMAEERAVAGRRQISVYFGASFSMRAIAQMMFRALALLRPGQKHTERNFFATEAEARAFVEQRRRELASEAGNGGMGEWR